MNPGEGVNPTRSATCLLFIFLHWTAAELSGQANGNVGEYSNFLVCFVMKKHESNITKQGLCDQLFTKFCRITNN